MKGLEVMDCVTASERGDMEEQEWLGFLADRLRDRNSVNDEMINNYLRVINRKERKVKNLSNSIRMTNHSTICDCCEEEDMKNSIEHTQMGSKVLEVNKQLAAFNDKKMVIPEKIVRKEDKSIKKKSLRELELISNNHISNFYPSRKSKFESCGDEESQKAAFQFRKVFLQKINLGENPLGDCHRVLTIDPNNRDIRQVALQGFHFRFQNKRKIKTESSQVGSKQRNQSVSRISSKLNDMHLGSRNFRSKKESYPGIGRGSLERSKRCLDIFLRMNREKEKVKRMRSVMRMQETPLDQKDRTSRFFRIGTIKPKKRF